MSYFEKVFHTIVLSCTIGFYSSLAFGNGFGTQSNNVMGVTEDHYKTVIKQRPYTVEVCKEVSVPGDRTADTLTGAIIGGVIGHQIGNGDDRKDNRNIGAIVGGMIGNHNSNATGGYRTQCQNERRYNEERTRVYSHSTITFWDNGREYTVRFNK